MSLAAAGLVLLIGIILYSRVSSRIGDLEKKITNLESKHPAQLPTQSMAPMTSLAAAQAAHAPERLGQMPEPVPAPPPPPTQESEHGSDVFEKFIDWLKED